MIAAAGTARARLLLRALWATGGRISEVLALRAADVRRDALVLPNLKNPARPVKTVFRSAGDQDLPGALLLFQKAAGLADDAPLFASRKRRNDGRRRVVGRIQAWRIVKAASERARVRVLALRESKAGRAGAPAPVHSHLVRHARVRQIVRQTRSLPLAQKQAGWSRLRLAYLTLGDDEARGRMRHVADRGAGAGIGRSLRVVRVGPPARLAAAQREDDRAAERFPVWPRSPVRPLRNGWQREP